MWAGPELTADQRDFLAAFAPVLTFDVDGLGPVLFCHGTPRRDDEVILQSSSQEHLAAALAGVRERTVICGHTHMQFDRLANGCRVVNAGSVGMPYGESGAHWALLGPAVSMRRTRYDVQAAAARSARPADGAKQANSPPTTSCTASRLTRRLPTSRALRPRPRPDSGT
jgi:Calcineurin-like phosphoesterase superfamily domain